MHSLYLKLIISSFLLCSTVNECIASSVQSQLINSPGNSTINFKIESPSNSLTTLSSIQDAERKLSSANVLLTNRETFSQATSKTNHDKSVNLNSSSSVIHLSNSTFKNLFKFNANAKFDDNKKLHTNLNEKLDTKLDSKLKAKSNTELNTNLEAKLDWKLNKKLNSSLKLVKKSSHQSAVTTPVSTSKLDDNFQTTTRISSNFKTNKHLFQHSIKESIQEKSRLKNKLKPTQNTKCMQNESVNKTFKTNINLNKLSIKNQLQISKFALQLKDQSTLATIAKSSNFSIKSILQKQENFKSSATLQLPGVQLPTAQALIGSAHSDHISNQHVTKQTAAKSSKSEVHHATLTRLVQTNYNATKDHVKLFSCGKLFYRTFHLDANKDILYVGAMDRIYKVNLANVNRTDCEADSIYLEPNNSKNCISKRKSEHYECRNHIRVIQLIENGKRLYVCGTNAQSPKDWILNPNLSELDPNERYPGIGNGIAKCPFDPEDNSTAVWVEQGNPGDLPALYSGSVAEFTRADSVIFRTSLYNFTDGKEMYPYRRTVKYDSKWLDKPNFVGSFDIGEHVYFFFRESAVEYINCGKNIFSRVARVCKKDIGGKNILAKNWASFLKARLNCSIPGEFPFYFNEIQHVTQYANDHKTFYGVFSTSNNGLTGSAICSFTLETIEKVFLGKFKEQASSSAQWLPVLSSKVPNPRPGSCHHNTKQLPDSVLNFIRSHPLMDEAVANQGNINDEYYQTQSEYSSYASNSYSSNNYFNNDNYYGNSFNENTNNNGFTNDQQFTANINNNPSLSFSNTNNNNYPIFYKKDLIFTKIAVDYVDIDGISYKLFYIGTSCGNLIKMVQWTKSNGASRSFVLDTIDVFTYNSPGVSNKPLSYSDTNQNEVTRNIRALELSSKHKSIYVATDTFIKQISLLNCKQRYSSCVQCVRDPHCGWDQNAQECKPYTVGLLQDIANMSPQICDQCAKQYTKQVNIGESLHLPCNLPVHLGNPTYNNQQNNVVTWHFQSANSDNNLELKLNSNTLSNAHLRQRFVQTSDNGLVVIGTTAKENGYFECRLSNKPLFRYQIIIDTKTCEINNENDFRKVYADWCHQFQKYKQELKRWQTKQMKCDSSLNVLNSQLNTGDFGNSINENTFLSNSSK